MVSIPLSCIARVQLPDLPPANITLLTPLPASVREPVALSKLRLRAPLVRTASEELTLKGATLELVRVLELITSSQSQLMSLAQTFNFPSLVIVSIVQSQAPLKVAIFQTTFELLSSLVRLFVEIYREQVPVPPDPIALATPAKVIVEQSERVRVSPESRVVVPTFQPVLTEGIGASKVAQIGLAQPVAMNSCIIRYGNYLSWIIMVSDFNRQRLGLFSYPENLPERHHYKPLKVVSKTRFDPHNFKLGRVSTAPGGLFSYLPATLSGKDTYFTQQQTQKLLTKRMNASVRHDRQFSCGSARRPISSAYPHEPQPPLRLDPRRHRNKDGAVKSSPKNLITSCHQVIKKLYFTSKPLPFVKPAKAKFAKAVKPKVQPFRTLSTCSFFSQPKHLSDIKPITSRKIKFQQSGVKEQPMFKPANSRRDYFQNFKGPLNNRKQAQGREKKELMQKQRHFRFYPSQGGKSTASPSITIMNLRNH